MNDLIETAEDPTALQCAEGLRLIGPAIVVKDGVDRGNFLVGSVGAASAVTDLAEFIIDPIASMAASAASFLMEYLTPLREALDSLAGSPSAVAAQSATWTNITGRVTETSADYVARTASALTGWEGPAATAYRQFVTSYASLLDGVGTVCSGIAGAMAGASAVVGFVRTIVRETIADLVGKLVSWAAQVAATAGVGASWVVPKAVRCIAQYVEKVRGWITDLTSSVRKLAEAVQSMNKSLDDVVPIISRIRAKVDVPIPVVPATTRTLRRTLPNINDLVPSGITTVTNGANSGVNTYRGATADEGQP